MFKKKVKKKKPKFLAFALTVLAMVSGTSLSLLASTIEEGYEANRDTPANMIREILELAEILIEAMFGWMTKMMTFIIDNPILLMGFTISLFFVAIALVYKIKGVVR